MNRADLLPLVRLAREIVLMPHQETPHPGQPNGLCQDWCFVFSILVRRELREKPVVMVGFLGPLDHAWIRVGAFHCDGTADQFEGLLLPPASVRRRAPWAFKEQARVGHDYLFPRLPVATLRSRTRRRRLAPRP